MAQLRLTSEKLFVQFSKETLETLLLSGLHLGLLLVLLLPAIQDDPVVFRSVLGAELGFIAWQGALFARARTRRQSLGFELDIKPNHYFQFFFQGSVYLYLAISWHGAFEHVPELVAQWLFAYLLDLSVDWTRGRPWKFGFGPVPIVLSINLFTWFKPEYFYLQLALVATGVLGKKLITRMRDGVRTHVFNPSGFALAVVSFALLFSGRHDLTRNDEVIPSFHLGFNMPEVIFLVGLVVNIWFPTILITAFAVVAMMLCDQAAIAAYGAPLIGVPIDVLVFLGTTLLVTDPATSPRGSVARVFYGLAYGFLIYVAIWLLLYLRLPSYYDKILPVPLLNLLAPRFDGLGTRIEERLERLAGLGRLLNTRVVKLGAWSLFFIFVVDPAMKLPRFKLYTPGNPSGEGARSELEPGMKNLSGKVALACLHNPDLCAPFSFVEELRYRMRSH